MKVAYITNSEGHTGTGVRANAILERLKKMDGVRVTQIHLDGERGVLLIDGKVKNKLAKWPGPFSIKSIGWIRLGRAALAYVREQQIDLIHLTNQTLSGLADSKIPTIITVHDLIELIEPQSMIGGLFSKYLYRNIAMADRIISVSHFTARSVVSRLNVDQAKVTVIYNGVDNVFEPIQNFKQTIGYHSLLRDYSLSETAKIVLYVGSDHPRKNVVTALRAFLIARAKYDELVFIKVGKPGLSSGRAMLLHEIDKLRVDNSVRLLSDIDTQRLNELYNMAEVLVFPSRYEGFGLPPLQAMAAGCPVVTTSATSIPEVVGDDGEYGELSALVRESDDGEGMAVDIIRILTDRELANDLARRGLARAKTFSWDDAVHEVVRVYLEASQQVSKSADQLGS